uniref:ABC efflux pump, inner membrane subunit n=1 Tax=mine drainage metagenome TaxID=410659 RepID=E6QN91_9ZZZZ
MQSFQDILGQVFQAMVANKLRTFLTMFGIAWGVGSLLVLVGLGEGFRSGQRRNLADVGNDVVMMWGGLIPAVPNQHTSQRPYKLTPADEEAMRRLPELRSVTAILSRTDMYEVSQWSNTSSQVIGAEPNFSVVRFVPLVAGRFLDASDLENRRRVAVLGPKTAQLLFPGHPLLGEQITINGTDFTVIGQIGSTGHGDNNSDNQRVLVPLTTMQELFAMKGENIPHDALTSIQYQPSIHGDSADAVAAVHRVIGANHGFDPGVADAFDEWDTIHTSRLVDKIFDAMDVFLGGVGVVTLGLGAVGIINIMLVSVTERTREIGLRKALGATSRSILTQFFLEGLILTTVSGVIGIGISAAFMGLLQHFLTGKMPGFDPPRLVWWSAVLALGCLVVCGIVAGVYPASQAAALEPVEALRRE